MINFADHQAALDKQKTELTAKFNADLEAVQAEATEAEAKASEATASLETVKTELETAKTDLVATKTELDSAKADVVVKVEEAKQEADKAGYDRGLAEGERRFNAQKEKDDVVAFCSSLFQAGKVTEQDAKSLPDTILALPAGEHRDRFRSLLESRPGVPGATSTFSAPAGAGSESKGSDLSDEQWLEKGRELMTSQPTKFASVLDAVIFAKSNPTTTKETV